MSQTADIPVFPDPSRYCGTAVNPRTFLATDYLNHFNEAIMLLELAGDMPDCVEDLKDWRPKSYIDHFEDSVFKDRHLCIEAYAFVTEAVRLRLESVITNLDAGLLGARACLEAAVATGDMDYVRHLAGEATGPLRTLIDEASGIINGVDEGAAEEVAPPTADHIDSTQATIDALFD